MIDFRYHLVSLVSIFLALALGIVIGTVALNGAELHDLHRQVKDLRAGQSSLRQDRDGLKNQLAGDDAFARAVGPAIVAGQLTGQRVLLITAPGASAAAVGGVATAVTEAGGSVGARVQLGRAFLDPSGAAALKDFATSALPAGFTLPSTDDAGALAGSLLADVLLARTGQKQPTANERQQVVAGFGTLSALTVSGSTGTPADLAVLVAAGQSGAGGRSSVGRSMANLAAALDDRARGVVVAGSPSLASDDGVVGTVRADGTIARRVSTVDDADRTAGQLVTVLALARQARGKGTGQYGTAPNATLVAPPAASR